MMYDKYIQLLKGLINTPSLSREEENAARVIRDFLSSVNIPFETKQHNTWALNRYFEEGKPVILLNSHIDTVKPAKGWAVDPFKANDEGNKLTGLGSNDAGGPLVALLAAFVHFYGQKHLPFNLVYAATAEEEISGKNGLASVLNDMPVADFAIIGEPTKMQVAIAEKGLMVFDCTAKGQSGHAARNEGVNALYTAIDDIQKLRNFKFEKVSELLGPVKITVTQIEAGSQHNVIPASCNFVVDVRTNEFYTNQQVLETIDKLIESEVRPRSLRLNSSGVDPDHPFVRRAKSMGINCYGSPTTSDQAVISFPSVKLGPGDSARSHTANEYILKTEIFEGIRKYIELLAGLEIVGSRK